MPTPADESGPPSRFRLFWEPWRRFPELRSLSPDEGERQYRAAWGEFVRRRRTWTDLACFFAVYALIYTVLPIIFPTPNAGWLVFYYAAALLPLWVVNWRIDRALPACVRAAMGTHCRECDYDLRATPDGGGSRLGRCPECGLKAR